MTRPRALLTAALFTPVVCCACATHTSTSLSADGSAGLADPVSSPVATEAPSASPDRAPSTAQIDSMLHRAVDPGVPAVQKIDLVQGATPADASLFDELVRLRQANPNFTWQIGKPVLEGAGLAKVPVSGLIDGANQTATATLAYDSGWKLQREFACTVVAQTGRSAPSCPLPQMPSPSAPN